MAFGVLLDTLLVRSLLVPALALLGPRSGGRDARPELTARPGRVAEPALTGAAAVG